MAYTQNTLRRAESILGYGIQAGTGLRTYPVIDGTVYTDLFTGTPVITGYTGTIKTRFNGSQTSTYKNEIILDKNFCNSEVVVDAVWGNTSFLTEIDELLQWLEDNQFTDTANISNIKSTEIEDFRETYNTAEDTSSNFYDALRSAWQFYIRNVLLISVSREQKDASRYF